MRLKDIPLGKMYLSIWSKVTREILDSSIHYETEIVINNQLSIVAKDLNDNARYIIQYNTDAQDLCVLILTHDNGTVGVSVGYRNDRAFGFKWEDESNVTKPVAQIIHGIFKDISDYYCLCT